MSDLTKALATAFADLLPFHYEGTTSYPPSDHDRTWRVYDFIEPHEMAAAVLADPDFRAAFEKALVGPFSGARAREIVARLFGETL